MPTPDTVVITDDVLAIAGHRRIPGMSALRVHAHFIIRLRWNRRAKITAQLCPRSLDIARPLPREELLYEGHIIGNGRPAVYGNIGAIRLHQNPVPRESGNDGLAVFAGQHRGVDRAEISHG